MPNKVLVAMLCIISLFAIIDLARSAKAQLEVALADNDTATSPVVAEPAPTTPRSAAPVTATSKANIVPAAWSASATR